MGPHILTLNTTKKTNQLLIENGYKIYSGSLGKVIKLNVRGQYDYFCLSDMNVPSNVHEYDIVIVDLSNEEYIDFDEKDHVRRSNKSQNDMFIYCRKPQDLLDPRPFNAKMLYRLLQPCFKKEFLLIVFQNENIELKYELIDKASNKFTEEKVDLYSFIPNLPYMENKCGSKTKVVSTDKEIKSFFNRYNKDFQYFNVFDPPTVWNGGLNNIEPNFDTLLSNSSGEIVSYTYKKDNALTVMFPMLEDNSFFLVDFLQTIAPSLSPSLFPSTSQRGWLDNEDYYLPNHKGLLNNKKSIEEKYEKELENISGEINANNIEYGFLHDLLTETGDSLVFAVIQYLKWLGFQGVVDMDDSIGDNKVKEEDIQIETAKGLLVIEVKGIGGTSKDSECAQIAKVKYRRAKERNKFDVFGLYIVNHQRYLPALNRRNPPFTSEQLSDAENDERGLLTTWQLFNIFYDIEAGIITKEEVRKRFYDYGLIDFKHKIFEKLPAISEMFKGGSIIILTLENIKIKRGDHIFIDSNGRFEQLQILEIKFNDQSVDEIENGEVGIKLNKAINGKSTQLYMKI
ncbi:hypothetical protein CMU30_06905 [Elizabethkingia anophelis]|nr:hypothetical protein [Elizabethkingia anophelis]MDV3684137.1 hypothetical protein [Elizabethkingia anophelis]MDV3700965.1 hypothetical protein [Elizabethkingia anophelis]MDV3763121.1 hypothetical protein [Elizabethkingia anophelis]MDV3801269.1 hypothetical protein [Elizabethkingia anophelis]